MTEERERAHKYVKHIHHTKENSYQKRGYISFIDRMSLLNVNMNVEYQDGIYQEAVEQPSMK